MKEKVISYRDLLAEGTASRVNAMKFRIQDIHEDAGFNLRDVQAVDENGETFEQSIERLADYIASGGIIPPVEVRIRREGGVRVVEGHRRRRAVLRCIERGDTLKDFTDKEGHVWLPVVTVEDDDVKCTVRMMTSDEKRKLTDLERAAGYKRLADAGLKSSEIAEQVNKSRPHVEQMLILANAGDDVHELVRSGKVTTTTAIDTARKHGEKAGELLGGKVAANGGAKLKQGDVKGKALPRKVVDEVSGALHWFRHEALTKEQRINVARAERDPGRYGSVRIPVDASVLAELMRAAALVEETRIKQNEKAREKAAKGNQDELEDDE